MRVWWHKPVTYLREVLRRTRRGIQYVEHTEGDGVKMFKAICKLGLEGIVSRSSTRPRSPGHRRRG
jgi:ATP-dependent DNA ligase